MAKEIIGYGLVSGYSHLGHGFYVLGITSESRGMVYGRKFPSDMVTHVRTHDVFYRFPDGTTEEFALASERRATAENAKHIDAITAARQKVQELERARSLAVTDAAKGIARPAICPRCGATSGDDGCHRPGACPMGLEKRL